MALTVRQDGQYVGGQPNNTTATWWNDYHDLLTGVMLDQAVTLAGGFTVKGSLATPTTAPSGTTVSGTALGIGVYQYAYTLVTPGGETAPSPILSLTTTSGNQAVSLSSVPTGAAPTSSRNIYRTAVGGSTLLLLHTLADNTTTSYTDTTADSSLGTASPPVHNQAGALFFHNSSGGVTGQVNPDGSVSFDGGLISSNGGGHLTTGALLPGSITITTVNADIEMGDTTSVNTPHIDFHSIAYANDYDTRIIASGGTNGTNGVGTLDIFASAFHVHGAGQIDGNLVLAGAVSGVSTLSMSSTLSGVTSITMNGALGGVTSLTLSGNISGGVGSGLPTTRNGAATSVPIYTGTNTPSSPPTGSIWVKA